MALAPFLTTRAIPIYILVEAIRSILIPISTWGCELWVRVRVGVVNYGTKKWYLHFEVQSGAQHRA